MTFEFPRIVPLEEHLANRKKNEDLQTQLLQLNKEIEEIEKTIKTEKNPPEKIIDDTGVRHWNEVPTPAKYQKSQCSCGTIHHISDESWYHSHIPMVRDSNAPHKIIKKCKKCNEVLFLELIKEPPK
jgi:hypothetical protein